MDPPLYRTFTALALSATVLHMPANQLRPTSAQKTFVLIVGIFAALYLINPTLGVFEFLPDNIPFLGNVDEATATLLLISALAFFGIKVPLFFQPKQPTSPTSTKKSNFQPDSNHVEEGEVIQE